MMCLLEGIEAMNSYEGDKVKGQGKGQTTKEVQEDIYSIEEEGMNSNFNFDFYRLCWWEVKFDTWTLNDRRGVIMRGNNVMRLQKVKNRKILVDKANKWF